MMRKTALAAILLCNVVSVFSASKCCVGTNLITKGKKCVNDTLKMLTCEDPVWIRVNHSEFVVDDDHNLAFRDSGENMRPDQYCLTSLEKSNWDVMALCVEMEPVNIAVANVILSFISVVFIVLTIGIYLSLPQLLDTQGICLIESIAGLGLSFILLGIINLSEAVPHYHCSLLAYLMYSAFLYAFFWLNIVCFHIWRTIVKPKIFRGIKHWKFIYHIVGISGPLLLLAFLLTASHSGYEFFSNIHPGIGEHKCWFKDSTTTWIYFYGPISVLLCINIFYFVWTIVVLCRQMKNYSEKKAKLQKYRLLLCIKLFFIMGISWCFEVVSALFEEQTPKWLWIVPDAINALQGLFIFLILVVFRKKVLRALANKKICRSLRLPASWKNAQDDECEELEEELSLSAVHDKEVKANIPA